ncbi:MAG: peptidase S51 [Gammaproteobacteria bacterium]|nr:peptidase S51 [Gammaproteobacteria bacterium]HJN96404.1 cyanophycinase [Gammaproteobacteria bacterium]
MARQILLMLLTCLFSAQLLSQTSGPARGSLVIVGGGMQDLEILRRFAGLAGGLDAPIVVIPTASGGNNYDQYWPGLNQFKAAGLSNVTLIHTYDRAVADSAGFAAPIREARGVWFTGGRQWRLADSYLHTQVHEALIDLLARDGVIGGSSAGATILGSYLARGDSGSNTIMMGDHEEGFGFIQNIAIDQHMLRRNRQFDLMEIIEAKPELLGVGLDEDTAIVVRGNRFEVIGQSYIAIFDHTHRLDSGGKFYFLVPGDQFDMLQRQAYRPQTTLRPLERVVEQNW